MGLFTKNTKRKFSDRHDNHGGSGLAGDHGTNLYLYLSDTEWRALFVSPDGAPIGEAIVVAKNSSKSFADN